MTAEITIAMLLRGPRGEPLGPAEWKRIKARCTWVKQICAALSEAQRKVEDAWKRTFNALPEDLSDEEVEALNLPDPPEQAELDALHAQLRAVIDHDRWPPHLYFGGL